MTTETITVLHFTAGEPAHKIYRADGSVTDYSARSHVTFDQKRITGLEEFALLLAELEERPSSFIIRGVPIHPADKGRTVRRRNLGAEAAFVSRSTRLFCVDVDKVVAPSGIYPCSSAAIEHVIGLLPAEFQQASYVAQFSNSAGTARAGNAIKIHLWFWGERAYSDLELRRWAMGTIADWRLYNAVQPHYVARPTFDGLPDPFQNGVRVRYVRKEKDTVAVQLPELNKYAPAPGRMSEAAIADLQIDASGKVIDGREALLRDIRWSVLLRGHCLSETEFARKVWDSFAEKAETSATLFSGNCYTYEKVASLCARDWSIHGELVPAAEKPDMTALEAKANMEKEIAAALKGTGVTAIRATAGLGKTTATASTLMQIPHLPSKRVDIYARSKEEQRQWLGFLEQAKKDQAQTVRITLIEGRNETNCVQFKAAQALSASGVSVSPHLCGTAKERCKAYDGCPYREQFSSTAAGIRIYSHAHLPTPLHEGLPQPDIVVIDESFHNSATLVSKPFTPAQLRNLSALRTTPLARGLVSKEEQFRFQDLRYLCNTTADALSSGRPVLSELRGHGISPESLLDGAKLVASAVQHPRLTPHASVETIEGEIARCRIHSGRLISLIFSNLAVELETGREEAHSLMPHEGDKFRVCCRRDIMRRCDAATVLILDADCDEIILRAFFPGARVVSMEAKLNAEIVQIDDLTLSKSALGLGVGGKLNTKLIERVIEVVSEYSNPLVITYRSLIPHLKNRLPKASFGYFGNIRGSNQWKNFGTVVVVGRHCVPPDAIESAARALFWDAAKPLSFGPPYPRRYAVGTGVLISQDEIDPRCQALRVASRDAETRQALARLRLVHCEERKTVVLLSSQVVGVPIDSLIQLRPRRGVRLFQQLGGFLAFGPDELARLAPGDFKSAKEALAWRGRAENTPASLIETYKRAGVILAATTYRRPGQRGRSTPLLVDPLLHPRPELSVAKRLGVGGAPLPSVSHLDWEEWDNPDAPSWMASYRLRKHRAERGG